MIGISLTISEKVIEKIDKRRGDISRSKYVSKLLEQGLEKESK